MPVQLSVTPSVGDGTNSVFTLSAAETAIALYIDGLRQVPVTDFAFASGSTTFTTTTAPASGSTILVLRR